MQEWKEQNAGSGMIVGIDEQMMIHYPTLDSQKVSYFVREA